MKYLNQKLLLEIKKAVNDALEYCYKFVSDYNKANPEGKLKIKNKWLKKGTSKNPWKVSTTGYSDCKISKTYQIGKETKIAKKKPDSTSKKKKRLLQ